MDDATASNVAELSALNDGIDYDTVTERFLLIDIHKRVVRATDQIGELVELAKPMLSDIQKRGIMSVLMGR